MIHVHLVSAFKFGLLAAAGTAAGQLIEDHSISLATIGGVSVVVIPATVVISRQYQRLLDRIDLLEKSIRNLPCKREEPCEDKETV